MSFLKNLFKRKPKTQRVPQFAGHYYPTEPTALRAAVEACMDDVDVVVPDTAPQALVVPFGQLSVVAPSAGAAYRVLREHADAYDHIVMFAPSLRIPLRGLMSSSVEAFSSPLGHVWLNLDVLQDVEDVRFVDEAHIAEPSLEVQLPFLSAINESWTITPVLMGDGPAALPQALMRRVWHQPRTLILIATEFSHEVTAEVAVSQDDTTIEQLIEYSASLTRHQTSSRSLLNALSNVAADHQAVVRCLARHNSAQTIAPPPPLVVSYAALAYCS